MTITGNSYNYDDQDFRIATLNQPTVHEGQGKNDDNMMLL